MANPVVNFYEGIPGLRTAMGVLSGGRSERMLQGLRDQDMQEKMRTPLAQYADKLQPGLGELVAQSPRPLEALATYASVAKATRSAAPKLPTGYQMNAQSGQAELIPGVDPSFAKRSTLLDQLMPVLDTATGKNTYRPRSAVADNPDAFAPPLPQTTPRPARIKTVFDRSTETLEEVPEDEIAADRGRYGPKEEAPPGGNALPAPPPNVLQDIMENNLALKRVERAEQTFAIAPTSTGWEGWAAEHLPFGGKAVNAIDPQGIDARATIAELGNMKIKDLSGATVPVSEVPRLKQHIPMADDSAEVVTSKLKLLKAEMKALADEQKKLYGQRYRLNEGDIGGPPPPADVSTAPPGQGGLDDMLAQAQGAGNAFESLPPPADFAGKKMRDKATGAIVESDGTQWRRVQ